MTERHEMTDPTTPYGPAHYATRPTKLTLYLRTFLPWQVLRFVIVNLRMTVMILKSHQGRVTRRLPAEG